LTGKPESLEGYVAFQDKDIWIYLARDIWEAVSPKTEKLLISIHEYGRFWLWLSDAAKKQ
jgi:hypothetical protein